MKKLKLLEKEKQDLNIDHISSIFKDFQIFDLQYCLYMHE